MRSIELKKSVNFIFLPAIFLLAILSCSSILFELAGDTIIDFQRDYLWLPLLNPLIAISQIILAVILLVFSNYKPFESVFKGTLLAFIGIITFFAGCVFFKEHIQGVTGVLKNLLPKYVVQMYEPCITSWADSLLYISLKTFNFTLFSLMTWGFINRFTRVREGIRYGLVA
jgi:ATP/ADP translocase